MSRGLGNVQRRLLAILEPTPERPNPHICLADFSLSPSQYETLRRALAGLEKRELIDELLWWRLALCQRSKRYALPAVADRLTDEFAKRFEARHTQRLDAANEQINVVAEEEAQRIKVPA